MQVEPGMLNQPCLHIRVFMGRVVVEDQMHLELSRGLFLDRFQEHQELVMAMFRPSTRRLLSLSRLPTRRTGSSSRCVCSHASSSRRGLSSLATTAGSGPTPGST